ncbi:MAG: hypothetical protein AB7K04_05965, partial [Pseudorhodoplanes sp.]
GFALALADVERRGASPSATSLDAARASGVQIGGKKTVLAKLFGFGKNKNDEEAEPDTPAAAPEAPARGKRAARQVAALAAEAPSAAATRTEPEKTEAALPVPLPKSRPNYQLAAATPVDKPIVVAQATGTGRGAGNDVMSARGFWSGLPIPEASDMSSALRRIAGLSAEPSMTASEDALKPLDENDRVEPGIALAYAAQVEEPAYRPASISPTIPRRTAAATSVALKRGETAPPDPALGEIAAALPAVPARLGERRDDPWLRAVALTPSVERFMTTMLFGMPDFRNLQPLLAQPSSVTVMTFSADPHLGVTTTQFSGPAVVFMPTASFSYQHAALR